MARPRNDAKRAAIMAAATRVIARRGVSAPTAMISSEAGIANGTLFTYFETKADLFNALYLELQQDMAGAWESLPAQADRREQLVSVWSNWVCWAVRAPDKRRAMAQLDFCAEITPATRAACDQIMTGVGILVGRVRAKGAMRDTSPEFLTAIVRSLAEATMDFMVSDPANASAHCRAGFDALWRMVC